MTRPSKLLASISRYVVSEQWMETAVTLRAQHSDLEDTSRLLKKSLHER
jgi:hypothetical protein